MGQREVVGDWDAGFRQFSIVDADDALLLVCPEAPAGYEGHLIPNGPGRYSMRGGPFDGAELVESDAGGLSLGGEIQLRRLHGALAPRPGWGLSLEPTDIGPEEEDDFEHLWNWIAHPSRSQEVDLEGQSVCRFVQWLTAKDRVLFNGCHGADLDEITPATWPTPHFGPPPTEPVLYGTRDGICSMYLSLVDHTYADRVDHGVERFFASDGRHLDLYHFSTPPGADGTPFHPGVLYVLPRERFDPVPIYSGGPLSAEWTCPEAVRPLARLTVTPDDFPLLDSVALVD